MSEEPGQDELIDFAERMFELAREGDAKQLAAYLDAGVPVTLTTATGDGLLMLAAYHQRPQVVRVLLERGAAVDQINDRGQTPLIAAVFRQSEEIVLDLLAAGADPDKGGPSARATADFYGLSAMAALLA